jgi:hypothetical protein
MSKTNDTKKIRELTEAELYAVSGSRTFFANSSRTSMSAVAEALKVVAQK